MCEKIEDAVNELLKNTEIVKNKDFINLMGSLHEKMELFFEYGGTELLEEVREAVGEFVSVDWGT